MLYRYIFKEILIRFLTAIFIFTGILFLGRILKLVDLVVNKNVAIEDIVLLFSLVIPRFLEMAIPMSLLISVILVFGRLSADSELVVMRGVGMSLKRLASPVAAFSVGAFVLTLLIGLWLRPWANHRLGVGLFEIAKTKASAGLVTGVFNDLGPLTLYAENIDNKAGKLRHVLISDQRDDSTRNFIAKHGQIVSDDMKRTITLRLYDGSIHRNTDLDYDLTYFNINNINLAHGELTEDGPTRKGKRASEMYINELNSSIAAVRAKENPLTKKERKSYGRYLVEWHRRFVVATSCLFVAFIAMALGIQPSRGGHSWGPAMNITVGILVIVSYYLVLAFVTALSKQLLAPPWILMWLPNLLFTGLAIAAFRMMQREQWLQLSDALGNFFGKVARFLRLIDPETEPAAEEA